MTSVARTRLRPRRVAGSLWRRSRKDWSSSWRWLHNFRPTVEHRLAPAPLTDHQRELVAAVERTGFASSDAGLVLGENGLWQRARDEVDRLEHEQESSLRAARAALADDREKPYLYLPLGELPVLDRGSVFAEVADRLAPLADAYFGMRTQVRAYAVWHNLASAQAAADSQLWHRDREDLLILKAFLYLDDVDRGGGPFWYAPGTHRQGRIDGAAAASSQRGVLRSTDDQMAQVLERSAWIEATGPAGTLVLADTRGYHKGGHTVTSDRLLLTILFTSQDSGVREWFDRSQHPPPAGRRLLFRWSRGRRS